MAWWQRHNLTLSLIVAASACTALFLAYSDWRQVNDARALQASQEKSFAALDARVKATVQKRIDAAKKAEAVAKAKAEEDSVARKAAATANPTGTTATTAACDVTNPSSLTVVVNKKHCFNPIDWSPNDLSSVDGYLLRAEPARYLQAMAQAANTTGLSFGPSSAYRSYANQQTTYNNWVQVNGSQAAADTVSARPGFSEHQTGLAVDLKVDGCALECFATTAQYQWLRQHAAEYGFIERYPPGLTSITGYSPEAWHWRYVGRPAAIDMKNKGIQTLEEYLGISGGDYANS